MECGINIRGFNLPASIHSLMEGFGYHLTTKGKGWNMSGVRLWFCKPSLWILVMTHSIIPPQLWAHSWSFIARVEVECMPLLGVHFSGGVLFRVLSTKHDSSCAIGDLNARHSTLLFYRWYDLNARQFVVGSKWLAFTSAIYCRGTKFSPGKFSCKLRFELSALYP